MGYSDHYVVDGGKQRIILNALVTLASIMDNTPLLDEVRWVGARWHLHPKSATGDAKYGTIPNIVGCPHVHSLRSRSAVCPWPTGRVGRCVEQLGIRTYQPTSDLSQRTKFCPAERFHYEAEHDYYPCPQGQTLRFAIRRQSEQVFIYVGEAAVCYACPVKAECTESNSGRRIFRSFF